MKKGGDGTSIVVSRQQNSIDDIHTYRRVFQELLVGNSERKAVDLTMARMEEIGPSGFPLYAKVKRKQPPRRATVWRWLQGWSGSNRIGPNLLKPSRGPSTRSEPSCATQLDRIEGLLVAIDRRQATLLALWEPNENGG